MAREDLAGLGWVRGAAASGVRGRAAITRPTSRIAGRVDSVNLQNHEGWRHSRDAAHDHAARTALKVMLGSMVETSRAVRGGTVGTLADYLDLDGHWLLAHDPLTARRAAGA